MKLVFKGENSTFKVLGEPNSPQEVVELMLEDLKSKFIFPKEINEINFKPNSDPLFSVEDKFGYYLEE